MKFFLVSLSFLVVFFTYPDYIKAQDGTVFFAEMRENKIPHAMIASQFLSGYRFPKSEPAILAQMEHEYRLSQKFLNALSEITSIELISLEAALIDLRSQAQANVDQLWEVQEESMPRKCFLFYEVLLKEFIPKAEVLIEAKWEGRNVFIREHLGQEIQLLTEILFQAEEHLTQYQSSFLHVQLNLNRHSEKNP